MREETLKRFFAGEIEAAELAKDLEGSAEKIDSVSSIVRVEDMRDSFVVRRPMLISLCDAVLAGGLPAESLATIGFALMASDKFEWDADEDELMADVIADWSSPEINYSLTLENVGRFRGWLTGEHPYPERPKVVRQGGHVISVIQKESTGRKRD